MLSHDYYIKQAITVAYSAKEKGNLPFGCILVDDQGDVIEVGENKINSLQDSIAHAEIILIHNVAGRYSREFLSRCTIYTTDEPCPMCTSAIFWSGIGKLVFGLSKAKYYEVVGRGNSEFVFEIPCRDILKYGGRNVEVIGPLLEDEALALHRDTEH